MQHMQRSSRIVVLFFVTGFDLSIIHSVNQSGSSFRHGAPSVDGGIMGLKPDQGMTGAACGRVVIFVQLNFLPPGCLF